MTTGVTISCFLLSYLIAFALELSRLYLKLPWRMAAICLMAWLGILTHGLYLWDRSVQSHDATGHWGLPASLFEWGLLAAWILSAFYGFLLIRRPTNAIGPFLLPLVLAMIVAAIAVRSGNPFDRTEAIGIWSYVHGGSLSLGMVAVAIGFATAIMNLYQEYRLKKKLGFSGGLRLPSLEYLHTLGRSCLVITTIAIAGGLISGIALNVQRSGTVKWLEGGIVFSFGLLVWLLIASVLEWQAARRATSWSAYLNIASFLIVLIALVLVFAAPHGRTKKESVVNRSDLRGSPFLSNSEFVRSSERSICEHCEPEALADFLRCESASASGSGRSGIGGNSDRTTSAYERGVGVEGLNHV